MRLCEFCEKITKKKNLVYENENIFAMLGQIPSTRGHLIVVPKKHFTIMEHLPDDLLVEVFNVANLLSKLLIKKLSAKGVNLLVRNGIPAGQTVPHFCIHVIPRYDNDGLHLRWDGNEVDETRMRKYKNAIRTFLEEPEPLVDKSDVELKKNYLVSQLKRSP